MHFCVQKECQTWPYYKGVHDMLYLLCWLKLNCICFTPCLFSLIENCNLLKILKIGLGAISWNVKQSSNPQYEQVPDISLVGNLVLYQCPRMCKYNLSRSDDCCWLILINCFCICYFVQMLGGMSVCKDGFHYWH